MDLTKLNPLAPLIAIADKAFDRLFPDPAQAAQAKAAFAQQAAEMDFRDIQGFRDFVVAYEGAGEKVHPVLQILRGSVRPVLTYILAGLFAYGFVKPGAIDKDAMSLLFNLNLLSMGFWYGERAMKNLGLDLSKREKV